MTNFRRAELRQHSELFLSARNMCIQRRFNLCFLLLSSSASHHVTLAGLECFAFLPPFSGAVVTGHAGGLTVELTLLLGSSHSSWCVCTTHQL